MSRRYAFYFDSSACSGCKTCQIACKDQHNLPVGVLWRRVVEVTGGGWEQQGAAWQSSVFAYHLSISCNHCAEPACLPGCPTGAIQQRPDGIVLIEAGKCLGCGYCAWACPYGAPQYDPAQGVMTKCDFCLERVEAGLAPTCVAACPMRALDFGDQDELEARYGKGQAVYPLPVEEQTRPAIVITPHARAMKGQQS